MYKKNFAEAIRENYERCTAEEQRYLRYLYEQMPLSDVVNYPFDTFLQEVQWAIQLRNTNSFAKHLSDDLFLPYVLFHRVNEEEIEPCRALFGTLLQGRIRGCSMKEAALEVNRWCAEEATYRSTDTRTASARHVYRCGFGRCGEESVFVVNALRSVGLPARQVYAPKWSHCDDNHAWVEVWCDGAWYYLGACEPEVTLNRGWFDHAASRAMMIHSRWFENRSIPDTESFAGKEGMTHLCNQLRRYAKTTVVTIHVEDSKGNPIEGAFVSAEVLNEASFQPIASWSTDATGMCRLETGLGSLHILASKNGVLGEVTVDTRKKQNVICLLGKTEETPEWHAFDWIAPEDTAHVLQQSSEEEEQMQARMIQSAVARVKEKQLQFVPEWKQHFLNEDPHTAMKYMAVLSEKDRMDARVEVLEAHYTQSLPFRKDMPEEMFLSYIWNPRIADEVLTDWRTPIRFCFSEEEQNHFREDPKQIWKWVCENVNACPERERASLYTTPGALLQSRVGSEASQKVLCVAIARTVGRAARLHPVTHVVEYEQDGVFCEMNQIKQAHGKCVISGQGEQWMYGQNWSIEKRTACGYESLSFPGSLHGETEWELELEEGTYRILTTNRLPNGTQYAYRLDFAIAQDTKQEIVLPLRSIAVEELLQMHEIPNVIYKDCQGATHSFLEETMTGEKLFCWLEVGKEPTEHLLNELIALREEWKEFAGDLIFLLQSPEDLRNQTFQTCLEQLQNSSVGFCKAEKAVEMTARQMYVLPESFPLVVITKGCCTGCFATSGYAVGTGELLYRILKIVKKSDNF